MGRKALAYINFELPAYEFTEFAHTTSAPELYSFLAEFAKLLHSPKIVSLKGSQQKAIYKAHGMIPGPLPLPEFLPWSMAGFIRMNQDFSKQHTILNSTPDTFNQDVFIFNLKFYGAMAIALDQKPLLPLILPIKQ